MKKSYTSAFTIVELLIVIVVIGILAAISIVAYNGVQRSAIEVALKTELRQASATLEVSKLSDNNYPASLSDVGIENTNITEFQYTRDEVNKAYCLTAVAIDQPGMSPYYVSNTNQTPMQGLCPGHNDPNEQVTAATALAVGRNHACAIAGGKAYCWGDNTYGQLGNNSTTNSSTPVAVDTSGVLAGKNVTDIATGGNHTCAIADNQAYCWGYNEYGQLGNNSLDNALAPVEVNTVGLAGKTLSGIATGGNHSCVIANGQAYCWGINGDGQLGIDSSISRMVTPAGVYNLGALSGKTVTGISAAGSHTCAIASSQAYCWGYNAYGQLGNNSTSTSLAPVAVDTSGLLSGKSITSLDVDGSHSCVVADGSLYCWGYNNYGQLGNGNTTTSYVPIAVDTAGVLSGKTASSVSAGFYHVCALADGRVYCWGRNNNLQLGNNDTSNSTTPVLVSSWP